MLWPYLNSKKRWGVHIYNNIRKELYVNYTLSNFINKFKGVRSRRNCYIVSIILVVFIFSFYRIISKFSQDSVKSISQIHSENGMRVDVAVPEIKDIYI